MAAEFQALQRLSIEWHPYQIAGGRSDISILAKTAKDLAEVVKETLSLANVAMELVKLGAMLQSVNPLLIALEIFKKKPSFLYYISFSNSKNIWLFFFKKS